MLKFSISTHQSSADPAYSLQVSRQMLTAKLRQLSRIKRFLAITQVFKNHSNRSMHFTNAAAQGNLRGSWFEGENLEFTDCHLSTWIAKVSGKERNVKVDVQHPISGPSSILIQLGKIQSVDSITSEIGTSMTQTEEFNFSSFCGYFIQIHRNFSNGKWNLTIRIMELQHDICKKVFTDWPRHIETSFHFSSFYLKTQYFSDL